MMRGAFLAATRGARFMSAAAGQASAPEKTMGRITGVLMEVTRDGPRQRNDGTEYWIERYVVEQADGSAERCSRFLDTDDEPHLQTGGEVDFKVKRRGEYADVVSEDSDTVIETTLFGKVLAIDREGPLVSAKGNDWWVDWYTVESDGVEHRIRKPVFATKTGYMCSVGDEVDFKVKQKGSFPADILGLVRPEMDEVQGKVVDVETVGPKVGPSGKEYTMEFYTIETKPGVTVTASRFVRDEDQGHLAEEGQSVLAVCRHTSGGYTNLLSLSLI